MFVVAASSQVSSWVGSANTLTMVSEVLEALFLLFSLFLLQQMITCGSKTQQGRFHQKSRPPSSDTGGAADDSALGKGLPGVRGHPQSEQTKVKTDTFSKRLQHGGDQLSSDTEP